MVANTYLTLTIGPIVETLLTARYTREMWASSYLFSYIVREVIKKATNPQWSSPDRSAPIPAANVLLPILRENDQEEYAYGAGLYPDRIYFKSDNPGNDKARLIQALNQILSEIAIRMALIVLVSEEDSDERKTEAQTYILGYLTDYLRINILENDLQLGENIVTTITPYLDASEQYARLIRPEPADLSSPLRLFCNQVNGTFLFSDGFDRLALRQDADETTKAIPARPKRRFDSLIEIATRDLGRRNEADATSYQNLVNHHLSDQNNETEEEELIKQLKASFPNYFRAYHKYVAIVHVDGDNVGKIVGKVAGNPDNLRDFSGRLRDFALAATEKVDDYGGAPIYAGGDDMLFFAPVASLNRRDRSRQTIFDLFDELDQLFRTRLVDYARGLRVHEVKDDDGNTALDDDGNVNLDDKLLPSLSYGVSISFYKYPLFEARNASYDQLESIKHDKKHHKNGIGVRFLKHSGHAINFILHKHRHDTYRAFLDMLRNHLPDQETFLNSFTYKLEHQRVLLTQAGGDAAMLEQFFRNNFNEIWNKNESFFMGLIPFITALHRESTDEEKDLNNKELGWLQLLYAALRFIHFLKSKDTDNE